MIPIQFITHKTDLYSYEESAELALKGGCKWIQLRIKDVSDEEVEPVAYRIQELCKKNEATFIIDDRVELAKKLKADGVHLGKNDMPLNEARKLLGESFIIGGTANTFEEVKNCYRSGADYLGIGPFRYTETKKNLAPILGLDGYRHIIKCMEKEMIRIPICAIGGIRYEDVSDILRTGVQGIAVSGCILNAKSPEEEMYRMLHIDE